MEPGESVDRGCDEDVQQQRTGEVFAGAAAGGLVLRRFGLGSYGSPSCGSYFSIGWVTMLMFVMPACLTASITEAKAPKGTRSSERM